jgi:hypothetical protein
LLLQFCQDLESFAHVLVAFFNICGCGKIIRLYGQVRANFGFELSGTDELIPGFPMLPAG